MPLGREVLDFTVIARSSLQKAIAGDFLPSALPIFSNPPPQVGQVFAVVALFVLCTATTCVRLEELDEAHTVRLIRELA
jgi:anaerobic C4-dicarboxylate transporter